jgi:hypothetical protein
LTTEIIIRQRVLASITGDGPDRPISSRSTQLGKEDNFWESSLKRDNEMRNKTYLNWASCEMFGSEPFELSMIQKPTQSSQP